jgi:hypothetical protein
MPYTSLSSLHTKPWCSSAPCAWSLPNGPTPLGARTSRLTMGRRSGRSYVFQPLCGARACAALLSAFWRQGGRASLHQDRIV